MLSQLIWWSSIALEIVLLARGLRNRLAYRLPVFYGYIVFVVLQDVARFFTYEWNLQVYRAIYWVTELLGLAIGSLVVFQIYKVSLAAYPGAAGMAVSALAFVFFTGLAKGLVTTRASRLCWQTSRTAGLDMEG